IVQQLLSKGRTEIRLGVIEERGDVVLERTFAPSLVIDEKRPASVQHDIPRLKIAIQEIVVGGAQQKIRQSSEIIFERLFVERDARESEEVILKIIQIPSDRLTIEAITRIANAVVQGPSRFDL